MMIPKNLRTSATLLSVASLTVGAIGFTSPAIASPESTKSSIAISVTQPEAAEGMTTEEAAKAVIACMSESIRNTLKAWENFIQGRDDIAQISAYVAFHRPIFLSFLALELVHTGQTSELRNLLPTPELAARAIDMLVLEYNPMVLWDALQDRKDEILPVLGARYPHSSFYLTTGFLERGQLPEARTLLASIDAAWMTQRFRETDRAGGAELLIQWITAMPDLMEKIWKTMQAISPETAASYEGYIRLSTLEHSAVIAYIQKWRG